MRVIIIEDEKPASEKLQKALEKAEPSVQVVAKLSSIKESVQWLQQNEMPELLLMDIELGDGLSFKIFDKVNVSCPVIFCTAFDEYWQEAFEHNSIDYLLKPVRQDKLESALSRYDKLKKHFTANFQKLTQWQQQTSNSYRKRFLVKRGDDYISVPIDEVAYFYATYKLVCLVDKKSRKFILDQSLADIENQLDASQFNRVNRKYLVNLSAIKKIKSHPKSKLLLELEPSINEEVVVSQENVTAFKAWMGK